MNLLLRIAIGTALTCVALSVVHVPDAYGNRIQAHHSLEWQHLERIAAIESQGNPKAINWDDRHSMDGWYASQYSLPLSWGIGSFGKYQIWRVMWHQTWIQDLSDEPFALQWAVVRPDLAPENIQFKAARAMWRRYDCWPGGKGWCPWWHRGVPV